MCVRNPSSCPSWYSRAPSSADIDDRRGPRLRRLERRGRAWLVVVLDEADQALLVAPVGLE